MPISPEFIIDEETPIRERYWQPKAGDVCIDIGAFHGSYTLPALAAGATVYAIDGRIEPLKVLRKRADGFGLSDRLTLVHSRRSRTVSRTQPSTSRQSLPAPSQAAR
jgi:precorrin-6B methylase 2